MRQGFGNFFRQIGTFKVKSFRHHPFDIPQQQCNYKLEMVLIM